MNDVWIGSNFQAPTKGVLILGESTYGAGSVADLIRGWIYGARDQTFSRIFNAFSGHHTDDAKLVERAAFWDSVAFCNFVQEPVGLTCDDRPDDSHYRGAVLSLPRVLQIIRPRAVLILGSEQGAHSRTVVSQLGIPCVVAPHPTGYGVETATLRAKWDELQQLRSAY